MACKNLCTGSCTCESAECTRVKQNYSREFIGRVHSYKDLKDLSLCTDTVLPNGHLVYVADEKKYVIYDQSTNKFYDSGIVKGTEITLP